MWVHLWHKLIWKRDLKKENTHRPSIYTATPLLTICTHARKQCKPIWSLMVNQTSINIHGSRMVDVKMRERLRIRGREVVERISSPVWRWGVWRRHSGRSTLPPRPVLPPPSSVLPETASAVAKMKVDIQHTPVTATQWSSIACCIATDTMQLANAACCTPCTNGEDGDGISLSY